MSIKAARLLFDPRTQLTLAAVTSVASRQEVRRPASEPNDPSASDLRLCPIHARLRSSEGRDVWPPTWKIEGSGLP